jgi:hypothetical protein
MFFHYSLWLNEGFAHYMQYLGAHHAQNNDSSITDVFVIKGVQAALERGRNISEGLAVLCSIFFVYRGVIETF